MEGRASPVRKIKSLSLMLSIADVAGGPEVAGGSLRVKWLKGRTEARQRRLDEPGSGSPFSV